MNLTEESKEWIRINSQEDLPLKDGARVLVTNGIAVWEDVLGVDNIFCRWRMSKLKEHNPPVTHWRPMPKPVTQ